MKIFLQPKIDAGKLNDKPGFYKSLTNNATISRLRGLDVKTNMPYIVEFLEGTANLEFLTLKFTQKYKQVPLVLGLIERSDLGQRVTIPIQPDNTWMFVSLTEVRIGKTGGNELKTGDRVRLRVYNLDMFNLNTINITTEDMIPINGWITAVQTWTYASADDPTFSTYVAGDVTNTYSVGMKVRLVQSSTTKYFIITKVSSYDSANDRTTITLYGGVNYDLANSTIDSVYYSPLRSPFGFPMNPEEWQVLVESTSNVSQGSPTVNVWYNLGSLSISVPIGIWDLGYSCNAQPGDTAAALVADITLSTSTSSESDIDMTTRVGINGVTPSQIFQSSFNSKFYNLASKTSYYLLQRSRTGSISSINFRGDVQTTRLFAKCALL